MEQIEKEFNDLIEKLTDEEFWNWVRSWYNEDSVMDIINNWDMEVKAEEIDTLKKIIKERKDE